MCNAINPHSNHVIVVRTFILNYRPEYCKKRTVGPSIWTPDLCLLYVKEFNVNMQFDLVMVCTHLQYLFWPF